MRRHIRRITIREGIAQVPHAPFDGSLRRRTCPERSAIRISMPNDSKNEGARSIGSFRKRPNLCEHVNFNRNWQSLSPPDRHPAATAASRQVHHRGRQPHAMEWNGCPCSLLRPGSANRRPVKLCQRPGVWFGQEPFGPLHAVGPRRFAQGIGDQWAGALTSRLPPLPHTGWRRPTKGQALPTARCERIRGQSTLRLRGAGPGTGSHHGCWGCR